MKPGDVLEPLVIESVSTEPMKTMAALLGDPTPIHYDADVVRALGMGDAPINQGPMNIGYLVELACRAGGGPEALRRIAVRLHGSVFAGDRVECTATVTAVDEAAGTAELELRATSGGRDALSGSATIATR